VKWLRWNLPLVGELALTHLLLSVVSLFAAVVIALPLGRLAWRVPLLRGPLLTGTSLLYALPSLPLLIAIPVLIGTPLRSPVTMAVALTLYAVAVLVRTVANAFESVPAEARQAAIAVGYSSRNTFWRVDLPLAAPMIIAGLRVTAVATVSLVTVGAVIGIRSLGTLFTDGFQRGLPGEVLTGLITTIVLALVLDGMIAGVARISMPWTRITNGMTCSGARV
jgi:osmoprotectant transport system permease protein